MTALLFLATLTALLWLNRALYLRCLLLEVQVGMYRTQLRERKTRLRIPENVRRLWVWVVRLWDGWREVCLFVKPATVLDWHERRYRDWWTLKVRGGKKPGRPRIPSWARDLVVYFATHNPWGPKRIQGEILRLCGLRLHVDTVRDYMPKRESDPRKVLSWRTFLKLHSQKIAAMDFFVINRWLRNPLMEF